VKNDSFNVCMGQILEGDSTSQVSAYFVLNLKALSVTRDTTVLNDWMAVYSE
jgi:hypothetical protein